MKTMKIDDDHLVKRLQSWASARANDGPSPELMAALREGRWEETGAWDWLENPPENGRRGHLGHFELCRAIAAGGMGVVFEAWDPALERTVAVKVLKPALAVVPEWREQFLNEAKALAAIDHDSVMPIYEVVDTDEEAFLVMPLATGGSLEAALKRGDQVIGKAWDRLAWQLADALSAVHAAGLIHGDVKPGNILLDDTRKRAWLADFGIAGTHGLKSDQGTPGFLAPERQSGGPMSVRTDLYELGETLRRAAGKTPLNGWRRKLVIELTHQNPVERPLDGASVLTRIRQGRRRKNFKTLALAALLIIGMACGILASMSAGLTGNLNRSLAALGGGEIRVAGRLGTFNNLQEALDQAKGRPVILDFNGRQKVSGVLLPDGSILQAGKGRVPILTVDPGEPAFYIPGGATMSGLQFERDSTKEYAPAIVLDSQANLIVESCVFWDHEGFKGPIQLGSTFRMNGAATLTIRDSILLMNRRTAIKADGQGGQIAVENVVFGGTGGIDVRDSVNCRISMNHATLALGSFLALDQSTGLEISVNQSIFIIATSLVRGDLSNIQWHGSGNIYQGRGRFHRQIPDLDSWLKQKPVTEIGAQEGDLSMPTRGLGSRVAQKNQIMTTLRSWPASLDSGVPVERLPFLPE